MVEWDKTLHDTWCFHDGVELDYDPPNYSTVYSNMWLPMFQWNPASSILLNMVSLEHWQPAARCKSTEDHDLQCNIISTIQVCDQNKYVKQCWWNGTKFLGYLIIWSQLDKLYNILLKVCNNDMLLIWDISHYLDNTVGYLANCKTFQYRKSTPSTNCVPFFVQLLFKHSASYISNKCRKASISSCEQSVNTVWFETNWKMSRTFSTV